MDENIKLFLAQNDDKLDFWKALELYKNHPKAKKNIVKSATTNYKRRAIAQRIIYELEKITGYKKYTNRVAVFNTQKETIPTITTYQPFAFETDYENLPKKIQNLVIKKGQLYNELDKLKKDLAKTGKANDPATIEYRKMLIAKMQVANKEIINIHNALKSFDNSDQTITNTKTDKNENPIEYDFTEENYYKLKDELTLLRSAVARQIKRAEETKNQTIKIKNLKKAEEGKIRINEIETYLKAINAKNANKKEK